MEEKYLIWSFEHNGWWGKNYRGYVEKIEEAGVYDRAAAYEIVRGANSHGKINEALVPVPATMIV